MDEQFLAKVGTATRARRPTKAKQNHEGDPITGEAVAAAPTDHAPSPFRRWSHADGLYWPASPMRETLKPGFYAFTERPNLGYCLEQIAIELDNLIELPDTASEDVIAEFDKFWTLEKRFAERGFLHKRGMMLWGPPGSGKTSSLMLMAAKLVKAGGIVCKIDHPIVAARCLAMIRKIEPRRPIVAILEDIDALIERYGESEFLSLLDGETQVNRIVYIATTNYPERLDKRFVDRPSRFDTVRYIGMPSAAARRVYLRAKESSLSDGCLDAWVRMTDGFSIAHLRELIILVQCFDYSLEAAVARLDKMRERVPNSGEAPDRPAWGIVGS